MTWRGLPNLNTVFLTGGYPEFRWGSLVYRLPSITLPGASGRTLTPAKLHPWLLVHHLSLSFSQVVTDTPNGPPRYPP